MGIPDLSGLDTSSQISIAVAKKSLDATKGEGEAVVALIRSAIEIAKSSPGAVPGVNRATNGGLDLYA